MSGGDEPEVAVALANNMLQVRSASCSHYLLVKVVPYVLLIQCCICICLSYSAG